jgi:hypothetical protein
MSDIRRNVLAANTEKIEHCFVQAWVDGIADPIVIVLDLSDDLGLKIASTRADKNEVARQLKFCAPGMKPVLTFATVGQEPKAMSYVKTALN